MKNLLVIIFIFNFTNNVTAQNFKGGKITYNITKLKEKNPNSVDPKDIKLDEMLENEAKNQKFVLEFTKNKSSFKLLDNLGNYDKNSLENLIRELSRNKFTSFYNFFINLELKTNLSQYDDGFLVEKKHTNLNWDITKEEKVIGNYKCYKATYTKTYFTRTQITKSRIIEAWFCPTIPFSYGPCEYYGLPGLILELSEKGTIFLATKIELFNQEIEIDFPKGKTISQEEYERKVLSGN